MRGISLPQVILAALLVCLIHVAPAQAQATRTWVSGVGDDANPCSRTAPCKTFAGAISKTAISGVINCLDPGGFGAVTITKSISIDCHETIGSVLVAGTNGITINGAGAIVNLRGLDFQGIAQGLIGISILAASTVTVEDVVINGFTSHGISDTRTTASTELFVKNTSIRNNRGAGVFLQGTSNTVTLENVFSFNNGYGLQAATGNFILLSRSVMSGNTTTGVSAAAGAQILVNNTEIGGNGTGISAAGTAPTTVTVILANSDIFFNGTGITGAGVGSYGNNRIFGNTTAGPTPFTGAATTDHGQE
jgi:hypothetical protein